GDRILCVNGVDLVDADHQTAVTALVTARDVIDLKIRHDPLPSGYKEVIINRDPGEKLGMNIKGGRRGNPGNPLVPGDEGVFISKVNQTGAVIRNGGIKAGMRLIEVNGTPLLGVTHQEAVATLRTAGNNIKLTVCDGYDPGEVEALAALPADGESRRERSDLSTVCVSLMSVRESGRLHSSPFLHFELISTISLTLLQDEQSRLPALDGSPEQEDGDGTVIGQQAEFHAEDELQLAEMSGSRPQSAADTVQAAVDLHNISGENLMSAIASSTDETGKSTPDRVEHSESHMGPMNNKGFLHFELISTISLTLLQDEQSRLPALDGSPEQEDGDGTVIGQQAEFHAEDELQLAEMSGSRPQSAADTVQAAVDLHNISGENLMSAIASSTDETGKSTPDRLLSVVRAADRLGSSPSPPLSDWGGTTAAQKEALKSTTVVLSKHTLENKDGAPLTQPGAFTLNLEREL
ncbi:unnamed protein product, partial [Cyprideis torosa]